MNYQIVNKISKFPYLSHKRYLGNIVRGPRSLEIKKNFAYAMDMFKDKSYTYHDFKQKCESLRIFIYFGVVGYCALDMLFNPLKSSYWNQFLPVNLVKNFIGFFSKDENNIFKHNGNASYEKYIELIK
ncbi:conserved Plasmodium protein, unknown function [Plasmodium vinckei brucechwatti]|uniref:Uncharacterized protein n=1 Tax=Plasmodium vinckei brucechwatti TaxID=119398 RepID=A0A6V7RUM7_PLAVN|nr:conserved Plasmodium protein, unknown function [Plasmodium vinckei brucechwatti]